MGSFKFSNISSLKGSPRASMRARASSLNLVPPGGGGGIGGGSGGNDAGNDAGKSK